ncbi:hypothetical protein ACETU7_20175 [Rhodococcus sp. 3Y1]
MTRTDSADHTTWFSYHPLLREHLRAEFRRVDHVERNRVHLRAASWFESNHFELEALELEVSIGDPHRILAFLERCGLGLVLDGTAGTSCESWNRCRRRFRNPRSPDWCWRRPPSTPVT